MILLHLPADNRDYACSQCVGARIHRCPDDQVRAKRPRPWSLCLSGVLPFHGICAHEAPQTRLIRFSHVQSSRPIGIALESCHRIAKIVILGMLANLGSWGRQGTLEAEHTHVMQGLSVETDISNPDPAIHKAGVELLNKSMQVAFSSYHPFC